MKKATALILLFILLLSATACRDDEIQTVENYEYNASTTAVAEETSLQTETTTAEASDKSYTSDDSWKNNYAVTYRYFNSENDASTVTAKEWMTENAFVVTYPDTASSIYYKANGSDTDMYTISTSEYTHTLLTGKAFINLSSLFMKLSEIEDGFTELSNVMYMGTETVAGRECLKYIQRAYSDGEVTQTVYVWIDSQYGFGAKCQALDSESTLTISWEVLSFESGEVEASDSGINLSSYKFTEAE